GLWQWLLGQVSPARQWEISFTTLLQSAETADRYTWCAGWPGTAAAAVAKRESHRIVDLTSKHLSEGLQRLVLQGEETVASTPRRYVSSEPVENKPSIVRPVGRLSQSRPTEVLSEGSGSGAHVWAIWGLLAVAVVA